MAKILLMEDGHIKPIESSRFEQEAVLQTYLEQYPELLPLHEVEDNPPPMITIEREVGVPSGTIDLLFLDTAGRLTIVETKLVRNPEVRREVIGQIIEYASFVCQWDADQVERQTNEYLRSKDAEANLYEAVGAKTAGSELPVDESSFRSLLEENLHKGSIRLVIAVDELVEPLRATVSFLNSFSTFDLLILQLREFKLDSRRGVFIPSLFGYTRPPTNAIERRSWTREEFLADAEQQRSSEEVKVIRALYELAAITGRAQLGTGKGGSFTYRVSVDGKRWCSLITVFNSFGIQISFGMLKGWGVPQDVRAEFRDRLNAIPGIRLPADEATLEKYPSIPFAPLVQPENFERFKEILLWLKEQALKAPQSSEGEPAP